MRSVMRTPDGRTIAVCLLGVVLLAGCRSSPPGATGTPLPAIESIEASTLPTGIQLVTIAERLSPLVVAGIFVPCGSVHDPPGAEGLAHLVEHVVTGLDGDGHELRSSAEVLKNGGFSAAYTFEDYTVYVEAVPPADLDMSLTRARRRLERPTVTPEVLATSKAIVSNELRLRFRDAPPAAVLIEHLRKTLMLGSAYEIGPAGREESIASLDSARVVDFQQRRCLDAPPSIVITGDLGHEESRESVERAFAGFPISAVSHPDAPFDLAAHPDRVRIEHALAAFPLRIEGTRILDPSAETRLDIRAVAWALCGHSKSLLRRIRGLTGVREISCGTLENRRAIILYVLIEGADSTTDLARLSVVSAAVSRLWKSMLEPDLYRGFMSPQLGWKALDPFTKTLKLGRDEMLSKDWRKLIGARPPPGLALRVFETSRRHLSESERWVAVDLLPARSSAELAP